MFLFCVIFGIDSLVTCTSVIITYRCSGDRCGPQASCFNLVNVFTSRKDKGETGTGQVSVPLPQSPA